MTEVQYQACDISVVSVCKHCLFAWYGNYWSVTKNIHLVDKLVKIFVPMHRLMRQHRNSATVDGSPSNTFHESRLSMGNSARITNARR